MRVTVHLIVLVATIIFPQSFTASAAAAGDQHSHHLCEGGGFNLICGEGSKLHLSRAWFGRLAHDTTSCINDVSAGNASADLQPDLERDCGVSVLDEKDAWCQDVEHGSGCSIAVESLGIGLTGNPPCPDTVTKKYLYLEYHCVGGEENSAPSGIMASVSLAWLHAFVLYLVINTIVSH